MVGGRGIVGAIVAAVAIAAPSVRADIDPVSGIDFVRVGAAGNAPWAGDGTSGDRAIGRGGVGYEYSIGKYEVTTAQWVEFFNAAYDRADGPLPNLTPPTHWGAVPTTPNTPGGQRWRVPAGNEMMPVGNISWRMSAMLCNWYENNKGTDRSAFMNGAYDVSTFGYSGTTFTDQLTHNPRAHYWIPTWDEWLKAAHYDPNRSGQGQGGWWRYSTTSDNAPAYGPPGVHVRADGIPGPDPNGPLAQANAGWDTIHFTGFSPFAVPLGAYPTVTSPWGLLDTAGGTSEWTEDANLIMTARRAEGSPWGLSGSSLADAISYSTGDFPSITTFDYGFRIASAVPSPGLSAYGVGAVVFLSSRRNRKRGGAPCVDSTYSERPARSRS